MSAAGFTLSLDEISGGTARMAAGIPADLGPGAESAGLWFERAARDEAERLGARLLRAAARVTAPFAGRLDAADRCLADYVAVSEIGFPAYLGGPLALLAYLGEPWMQRLGS